MSKLFILLIRLYKKILSPLFPPRCRFVPSCSTYAIDAIHQFGAFRGVILAVYRILRCQPFCKGGYDPVDNNPFFQKTGELKRSLQSHSQVSNG